ncbi:MAG: inorganic phosphate transporter [bacterium]
MDITAISLPTVLFYLSSGLFLGWSLGANDAANIFGTAVASRMVRFSTAALICSVFIVIGAVVSGSGAAHTLGKLGAVNTMAGAFTVALSAALTVFFMTKFGLPVSTSQAIVGGILGWNFFSGIDTNYSVFRTIMGTWILCPVLSMLFSFCLFYVFRAFLGKVNIHLIRLDSYTRLGLLIVGAFGAYSLGANNIANVMGVFVPASPFQDISLADILHFTKVQQLFLLGAAAIALGVYTYSKRVMLTVGEGIYKLSPITGLIVVLAASLVLFVFSSTGLNSFLVSIGLPPIPLVPLSSSQAVVGAVIGIGVAKGVKNVQFGILGRISLGWVFTPILSALISFIFLFFMQNVFMNQVHL